MSQTYINLPDFEVLPAPVYFRYSEFAADSRAVQPSACLGLAGLFGPWRDAL